MKQTIFAVSLLFSTGAIDGLGRSSHRAPDPCMATLYTQWLDGSGQCYQARGYDFSRATLFEVFDRAHFMKNMLPTGPIPLRQKPETFVDGSVLSDLINDFVTTVLTEKKLKKKYQNFKVLKKNNFNAKRPTGLIIIKFMEHPFVVKLFIETPQTFIRPYLRDLEQCCLFHMGGGVSRYISGFTRIKNLHYIQERVTNDPSWSKLVDAPRKWFWIPTNVRWFEVRGVDVNNVHDSYVELPSIYAIVADSIEAERKLKPSSPRDRHLALSLTTWLDEYLDPNISNYLIEKDSNKLVIIDTEHFPTNLGMRNMLEYTSYGTWYVALIKKFFKDVYFRTKRERLDIRYGRALPIIICREDAHNKE